jgi:hypothetical protein
MNPNPNNNPVMRFPKNAKIDQQVESPYHEYAPVPENGIRIIILAPPARGKTTIGLELVKRLAEALPQTDVVLHDSDYFPGDFLNYTRTQPERLAAMSPRLTGGVHIHAIPTNKKGFMRGLPLSVRDQHGKRTAVITVVKEGVVADATSVYGDENEINGHFEDICRENGLTDDTENQPNLDEGHWRISHDSSVCVVYPG